MAISPTLLRRVALPMTGALVISAGLALVGPLSPASADTTPQTFSATGAAQTYSVPAWASAIQVTAYGAQGGGSGGGKGGATTAIVTVAPSSSVQVNVGTQGTDSAGGFNGGGAPGSGTAGGSGQQGGGGASDIRIGGTGLANRAVIAGGGGGGAGGVTAAAKGGGGGNPAGADGSTGLLAYGYGGVGTGGSQSAGGVAGQATGAAGLAGTAGTSGLGGDGGNYVGEPRGGSGGGGGYYGGGGGGAGNGTITLSHPVKGAGGPGGGGSSYVDPSAIPGGAAAPTYQSAAHEGDGQIVIQAIGAPAMGPASVSDVHSDSVMFSGQASTRNSAITDTYFKYSTTSGSVDSGTMVQASPATKATGLLNFSASVSGLEPGTQYYYKSYAVSSGGTSSTAQQTFTTSSEPTVVTGAAFLTDNDSTIVGGTINNEGDGGGSTAKVFYSTSSATVANGGGSSVTSAASPIHGNTNFIAEVPISNLQSGTTYYYRFQATNADGTGYGAIKSFTTTSSAANVSATFPKSPVGNRIATYSASVSAFGGGPLSGSVVFQGTDPLNRPITVCTARLSNGSGSCTGTIPVGTSVIDAKFNNGTFVGDSGAKLVTATGVSIKVDKVRGKGAKRKLNLSGKTAGSKQTVTIYRTKNGKTTKIGTDKSNAKGTWAKSNVALKAGGKVKVFAKVKQMASTKVNV